MASTDILSLGVSLMKIVDCQTIRQFSKEARDILLADTGRIDWLIGLAAQKFKKSAPGYENLLAKLRSIKVHYETGISHSDNAVLLRRSFRKACARASLPLSSRHKTRAESCLYQPQ
jgi:hypothetical protein